MSDSEARAEGKRKRGRPPQYGTTAVKGAVRQQWHREKQQTAERDMASLVLELWEIRPEHWRFPEMDERHAETVEHARRILSRKTQSI